MKSLQYGWSVVFPCDVDPHMLFSLASISLYHNDTNDNIMFWALGQSTVVQVLLSDIHLQTFPFWVSIFDLEKERLIMMKSKKYRNDERQLKTGQLIFLQISYF